jgi:hypothetical protein
LLIGSKARLATSAKMTRFQAVAPKPPCGPCPYFRIRRGRRPLPLGGQGVGGAGRATRPVNSPRFPLLAWSAGAPPSFCNPGHAELGVGARHLPSSARWFSWGATRGLPSSSRRGSRQGASSTACCPLGGWLQRKLATVRVATGSAHPEPNTALRPADRLASKIFDGSIDISRCLG